MTQRNAKRKSTPQCPNSSYGRLCDWEVRDTYSLFSRIHSSNLPRVECQSSPDVVLSVCPSSVHCSSMNAARLFDHLFVDSHVAHFGITHGTCESLPALSRASTMIRASSTVPIVVVRVHDQKRFGFLRDLIVRRRERAELLHDPHPAGSSTPIQ